MTYEYQPGEKVKIKGRRKPVQLVRTITTASDEHGWWCITADGKFAPVRTQHILKRVKQ